MLQGKKTGLAAHKALAQALRHPIPHKTSLVNYCKNGEAYLCEVNEFPVRNADGRLVNAIAIEREVKRGPGRPRRA